MPSHDLTVSCGNQILLDIQDNCATHGELKYLRPLTPDALKIAAGLRVETPLGFDDKKAFEILSDPQDFVILRPDEAGLINQQDPGFIRTLIGNIDDPKKIPEQICIEKCRRDQMCVQTLSDATHIWRTRTGRPQTVSFQAFKVPEWIVNFKVLIPLLFLNNITVEKNATLTLGQNVTALNVDNIYVYQGGNIVQNAPNLTVTVTGEVKGDL